MANMNLLYAQSGGVTAVINASAVGVIRAARAAGERIGQVLAARNGILGVLAEELVDTATLDDRDLQVLSSSPGGIFGSCRFDLDHEAENPAQFDRIFEVFAAHRIGYFLYNGGNGSMDSVAKLSAAARRRGYPLVCIGVPKTVDNDLEGTDCSPGFGSAAKYLATSMLEAGRDLQSMASQVGRVFVMEVMGRNAGWLAASTMLAAQTEDDPPHLVLLPEVALDETRLLRAVQETVERIGYCAITVAEGIRYASGEPVMEQAHDNKGHVQLGGAGQCITRLVQSHLSYKSHWAIPDYLQRGAGHLLSATDHAQALAVGEKAVEYALDGIDGVMVAIKRLSDQPYAWAVTHVDADSIANLEKRVPDSYLREDGLHLNAAARRYLSPLIEGEIAPAWRSGLPLYARPQLVPLACKLPAYTNR